jgi:hypothetical protein
LDEEYSERRDSDSGDWGETPEEELNLGGMFKGDNLTKEEEELFEQLKAREEELEYRD